MANSIADIISLSVLLVYIIPSVFLIYSGNTLYLIILSGLIVNQAMNHLMKSILGIRYNFCKRPKGAKDCDLFNKGGDAKLIPGFPSGHVSLVSCFVTMMLLFFGFNVYFALIGLVWVLMMMWSRIQRNCHTLLQTLAGAISGFIVACLWYFIFRS